MSFCVAAFEKAMKGGGGEGQCAFAEQVVFGGMLFLAFSHRRWLWQIMSP